jgi:YVTN family beta-propeller protein
MFSSSRLRSLLLVFGTLSIVLLASLIFFNPFKTEADVKITDQPGAEGRVITPAGKLRMDATTNLPAIGSLTVNFVRSPDKSAADGKGRFLIAVNSGYGIQFDSKSKAQQSLSVIDLNAKPEPQVIQNVYFPSPNSANFGVVFNPQPVSENNYQMFVAGGFENRIWQFQFNPNDKQPISPGNAPDKPLTAPSIDVAAFAENAPSPFYNRNTAAVYPTGLALGPDGDSLYIANNLGDTLGIVSDLRDARTLTRINLRRAGSTQFVYPYDVKIIPSRDGKTVSKAYVSLWGDGSIAVVDAKTSKISAHIAVDRHPTAMLLNRASTRLYVVNSNADTVSVIDTATDKLVEKINVKLAEKALTGASPEGLALSDDEKTLYVANAHANAIAVVSLASLPSPASKKTNSKNSPNLANSKLLGFIPTGQYASAVAVVGKRIFIANGKGTGVENSSVIVNNSGRAPNMPNENFPAGRNNKRGHYNPSLVVGNISVVETPTERQLFAYTQSAMRNNNLLGEQKTQLFKNGRSPFKHVIYIIRENRTYDQVFGDLPNAGDGTKADGDASVAIFGAGEIAKSPSGAAQNITPNARALALRFGLLDRFFVNAEASPDGHNWSTAAFSNDYIDKSFRWNYSGRGRTYDFEGFNRLPSYDPPANQPPGALPSVFRLPATENDMANYLKRYVPYLNGSRDIGEPETLYLWDAANRANLSYRAYGEFIATISQEDVKEVNTRKSKKYPDLSPTLTAFAAKKSLEGHFSPTFRNFDQNTPDTFTLDSYREAKNNSSLDPAIARDNADARFRGNSRFGEWQNEFRSFVADLQAGKGDRMPNLSIVRFSNDHTAGLRAGTPTPQFYVAENDYAVGRLVEEVSNSPYWKDTAIFILEDDAQDGPDHVDAHRSPALIISAYNRRGALVHEFHNTVSLIRTMEIILGIAPMNLLDATSAPIDIFTDTPDFAPYKAVLPEVALDNLTPPNRTTAEMREFMELTDEQNLKHADMANPREMNEIIWFSVRGAGNPMPEIARHPVFDLMKTGMMAEAEENEKEDEVEPENKSPRRKNNLRNAAED